MLLIIKVNAAIKYITNTTANTIIFLIGFFIVNKVFSLI